MTDAYRNDVPAQAIRALDVVREHLDDAVAGVYLFGSAVEGGLKPDSDVDLLVVAECALTDDTRQRVVEKLLAVSAPVLRGAPGRPIELTVLNRADIVPWRYPPKSELVYGEWLRDEFEKGKLPGAAHDPDLAVVISQARSNSITLMGRDASEMLEPVPRHDLLRAMRDSLPQLLAGVDGDERNVVLTLTRMWYTAATGEMTAMDKAAEWAMQRLPREHAQLLDVARKAYLGERRDEWNGKSGCLAETVDLMRTSIQDCIACGR